MAEFFEELSEDHIAFIARQPIFFTATAAADGRINLSPKGDDTFRVLAPGRVAFMNLTGSGNETDAHLKRDGRITVIAATAPSATETTEPAAAAPAAEAPAAATATDTAMATAATVYKVVAGDSLWKIAEATYGDGTFWSKIAEANMLRNPNVISIGRELQLPAK